MAHIVQFVGTLTAMSVFCMICEFLLPSGNLKKSALKAISFIFVALMSELILSVFGGML